jgi:cytidylate kinase
MIVAIYGKSCGGKTILSNSLSEQLSIGVRHCGEVVKELAAQVGVSPGELSPVDHLNIDEETRRAAAGHANLIIEGCFLDHVLAESQSILVELRCSREVRESRYQERNSSMSFEAREKSDAELKALLYGDAPERSPDHTVDTTHLKTEETVMEVKNWLQTRGLSA